MNFFKLNLCGNDFVIVDETAKSMTFSKDKIKQIAHRKFGIGCDQFIKFKRITKNEVSCKIYNMDGTEVFQCGNGLCSVAMIVKQKFNIDKLSISTKTSSKMSSIVEDDKVTLNIGKPIWDNQKIGIQNNLDPLHLDFAYAGAKDPSAIYIGNPHLVFFVRDIDAISLKEIGEYFNSNKFFKKGTNVELVKVINPSTIRIKIWERGCGKTMACGSGSVASFALAKERGLLDKNVTVIQDGGKINVYQNPDNTICIKGKVSFDFEGVLDI